MKRTVNLYVDAEAMEILKARGVNVSSKVSSYLCSLAQLETNPSESVTELKVALEDRVEHERAAAEEAELNIRIQPYIKFYQEQMSDSWVNHPERREKYIHDSCSNLGITPEKFLKLVEK